MPIVHAFGLILPDPDAQAEDIPDEVRAVRSTVMAVAFGNLVSATQPAHTR